MKPSPATSATETYGHENDANRVKYLIDQFFAAELEYADAHGVTSKFGNPGPSNSEEECFERLLMIAQEIAILTPATREVMVAKAIVLRMLCEEDTDDIVNVAAVALSADLLFYFAVQENISKELLHYPSIRRVLSRDAHPVGSNGRK